MSEDIFTTAARAILNTDLGIGEDATYQRLAGGDPISLVVNEDTLLDYVPDTIDVQVYIGMKTFDLILADLSPYEPERGDTITVTSGTYTVQAQVLNDGSTVKVAVV